VDLFGMDKLILSHGHYDHTGGLREVLGLTGEIDIIAHPDVWADKYAVYDDYRRKIGIPFSREQLEGMGARFELTREPVWVSENMVTTGEIPMITDYEAVDAGMRVREGDVFPQDELLDDLGLGIRTEQGLVVVLGCGHRGMINTIEHLKGITGEQRVYGVIGGTHLIAADEGRLKRTVDDLRRLGIKKLGASHCTGFSASCRLAREFPEQFFLNNSGMVFNLP